MDKREHVAGLASGLAVQDQAFQAFMTALLTPTSGATEAGEGGDEKLIEVWINAAVHADYKARGVFPEMTACELVGSGSARGAWGNVPEATARAMLADACAQAELARAKGNKKATKWSWLRSRLRHALTRD